MRFPPFVEIIESVTYLFSDLPPVAPATRTRVCVKKMDTTPFTQAHFDLVNRAHDNYLNWNAQCGAGNRRTLVDVSNALNSSLGLNKSAKAYSSLWNGTVQREDLPAGKVIADVDEGS
jgi:hypothetical protein